MVKASAVFRWSTYEPIISVFERSSPGTFDNFGVCSGDLIWNLSAAVAGVRESGHEGRGN